MQRFGLVLCSTILAVGPAGAQEYSRFTVDIGGGYTVPAGATDNYTRWGWNVRGGLGLNFSPYVGAVANLGYDSLPLNSATAADIGVPGGQVNVFHATLDPVFHLTPRRRVDFYLTGGGGEFHVLREFSAATAGPTSAYIPSLGFFAPVNGPAPIPSHYSVSKPGFDAGGGVSIGAAGHGRIFAEARWDHVFVNGGHLDFLPVTFGFRW